MCFLRVSVRDALLEEKQRKILRGAADGVRLGRRSSLLFFFWSQQYSSPPPLPLPATLPPVRACVHVRVCLLVHRSAVVRPNGVPQCGVEVAGVSLLGVMVRVSAARLGVIW